VSLFGHGVLTFHVEGIFRTPPGWNLFVTGSPNRFKDAIAPLAGVIETDWSPFTFTMNWRFTRPGQTIRFEAMEPFCFLFPVQRATLEAVEPRFEALNADAATMKRFQAWSEARTAFVQRMQVDPPSASSDRWQKHYYRGVDAAGAKLIQDHRAKLRLSRFDRSAAPEVPEPPPDDQTLSSAAEAVPAVGQLAAELEALRAALAQRDWLLDALERQRDLSPPLAKIERRGGLTAEEFLERYYAVNRPVILSGEIDAWPAFSRWTADYLEERLGDRIDGGADMSAATLGPEDLGSLERFLDSGTQSPHGTMWAGPAGAATPLHCALSNQLVVQVIGRSKVKLVPAGESGKLHDERELDPIVDLDDPTLSPRRYPRLGRLRLYDIELAAGEILFAPFGWWRQAKLVDFAVTITYENFRWPNDAASSHPKRTSQSNS
jgi:hypothetical protein